MHLGQLPSFLRFLIGKMGLIILDFQVYCDNVLRVGWRAIGSQQDLSIIAFLNQLRAWASI